MIPPRFRGNQPLDAKDMNRIRDENIRSRKLRAEFPLMIASEDESATVISLHSRPIACRAIVTQAITPPTSATATHSEANGWGYAQRQRYDRDLKKYVNVDDPVQVINPWPASTTTATVGKVIWIEYVDDVWQMPGENCT